MDAFRRNHVKELSRRSDPLLGDVLRETGKMSLDDAAAQKKASVEEDYLTVPVALKGGGGVV